MRSAAIQSPSLFVGNQGGKMESVTERGPAGLVRRTLVGRLAVLGVVSFLVAMLWPPGMAFSTPASGRTRVLAPRYGVPDLGRSLLNPAPGAGSTPALAVHTNVPSPGSTSSQLVGVSCTSTSNCWAVGAYVNGSGATLNEILRWNGSQWSKVKAPQPGGISSPDDASELLEVACSSGSNCKAVGVYGNSSGALL